MLYHERRVRDDMEKQFGEQRSALQCERSVRDDIERRKVDAENEAIHLRKELDIIKRELASERQRRCWSEGRVSELEGNVQERQKKEDERRARAYKEQIEKEK